MRVASLLRFVLVAGLLLALSPFAVRATDKNSVKKDDAEPGPRPRVKLPEGWKLEAVTKAMGCEQFASNPDLNAYFQVSTDPKQDFSDDTDLLAWAKLVRAQTAKRSKLANRKDTDVTTGKVGDRPTCEYEVTGEFNGLKLHYRVLMVEFRDYYVKITCWTTPSNWKAAQPKFEELVGHLR